MNVLHLFAGAGGGVLADRLLGFRSVGYVEIEPYCQAILQARIADGSIDPAPIFGDVREFIRAGHAREYRGVADVVAGGFPCQPFSVAGKRKGDADNRNLWPEFAQVVREVRPGYVFAENVPGLLTWDGGRYFGKIVGDLAALGYGVRWCVLGADDVGAPHRRKRLWILADSREQGGQSKRGRAGVASWSATESAFGGEDVADASGRESWRGAEQLQGHQSAHRQSSLILPIASGGSGTAATGCNSWWFLDPADLPDTEGQSERTGLCEDKPTGERRGRFGDGDSKEELPDTEGACAGRRDDGDGSVLGDGTGNGVGAGEVRPGEGWSTESRVGGMVDGHSTFVDLVQSIAEGEFR